MRHFEVKICDDEKYYLEELNTLVSSLGKELEHDIGVTTYLDVEELLQDIIEKKQECHILFLDVEMPKMTGVDAATRLRRAGYDGVICFVTSYDRYALDAYHVDALGYICKPAKYDEVRRLVKRACIQVFYQIDKEAARKRYIEVSSHGKEFVVDLKKVLYIEKRKNQAIIHMEEGEITCYEPLKMLHARLDQEKFVYTHQGFIANFEKIKEVCQDSVMFGEGCEIPVSRRYQKDLRKRHMDMIRSARKNRE